MTRQEILQVAKPILFNTDMVRAILDGRKTQTRRIANINDEIECHGVMNAHEFVKDETGFHCHKCGFGVVGPHNRYPIGTSAFRPRYNVGDYLYVRETWGVNYGGYSYFADLPQKMAEQYKWHPSIHMPKEAARLFLRVTGVRCELLKTSFYCDGAVMRSIRAEGIIVDEKCRYCLENLHPQCISSFPDGECCHVELFRKQFKDLWNSTVKPSDIDKYGWYANPWVWVYEFERVNMGNA